MHGSQALIHWSQRQRLTEAGQAGRLPDVGPLKKNARGTLIELRRRKQEIGWETFLQKEWQWQCSCTFLHVRAYFYRNVQWQEEEWQWQCVPFRLTVKKEDEKNMEEDSVEEEDVIEEDEQDAMVALHYTICMLQKVRKDLLALQFDNLLQQQQHWQKKKHEPRAFVEAAAEAEEEFRLIVKEEKEEEEDAEEEAEDAVETVGAHFCRNDDLNMFEIEWQWQNGIPARLLVKNEGEKNMEEDLFEEEDVIEEDERDAMVALRFGITLLQKVRKELLLALQQQQQQKKKHEQRAFVEAAAAAEAAAAFDAGSWG